MNRYVIDAQALIMFLNGQQVINSNTNLILKEAEEGKNIIVIPSVVIFETGYLHEKKRIEISIDDIETIINTSINYVEAQLSKEIIKSAFEIKDIPELHDKLIAGTARYLDLPLITNDPVILASRYVQCVT